MARPCVFLDRDGIVNEAPPPEQYYVLKPEQFRIMPEFLDALGLIDQRGYVAVVVTNQKSVHRGLLTEVGLAEIHQILRDTVENAGLKLEAIYASIGGDKDPDRKPRPGMLLKAATEHGLDLARSWMIGDAERDIEAGIAAGCGKTLLVGEGANTKADHWVASIKELPGFLDRHLSPCPGQNDLEKNGDNE